MVGFEDVRCVSNWITHTCARTHTDCFDFHRYGSNCLHADFANKRIGGGVLRGGCVQVCHVHVCMFETNVSREGRHASFFYVRLL